MAKKKSAWPMLAVVLFLGLVLGTILGEIGARVVATGSLHDFFATSVDLGVPGPVELDLRAVRLALGFAVKVNILGVLGIVGAALAYYRLTR